MPWNCRVGLRCTPRQRRWEVYKRGTGMNKDPGAERGSGMKRRCERGRAEHVVKGAGGRMVSEPRVWETGLVPAWEGAR